MRSAQRAINFFSYYAGQLGFTEPAATTETSTAGERFTFATLDPSRLEPAPIRAEWILEGNPEAKCLNLSNGTRGWASTNHWSCSKGKFRWQFGWDETVLILEGEVIITDEAGNIYHGRPGVSLFFPAGTSSVWDVPNYVRKIAFNQKPVPFHLNLADRVLNKLSRLLGFTAVKQDSGLGGA